MAFLTISFFNIPDYFPFLSTMIGLLFSVPISLFWFEYKSPILHINKNRFTAEFDIPKLIKGEAPTPENIKLRYNCYRISC